MRMLVSAFVRHAVAVVGLVSVIRVYRILSFDLHLTQWNAAQRARQAPSAEWSAVHFARPARTPKSQAHGISMLAAVATAVWLGRAARIASWPAVVTRPARTKRSRPAVWMVWGTASAVRAHHPRGRGHSAMPTIAHRRVRRLCSTNRRGPMHGTWPMEAWLASRRWVAIARG